MLFIYIYFYDYLEDWEDTLKRMVGMKIHSQDESKQIATSFHIKTYRS